MMESALLLTRRLLRPTIIHLCAVIALAILSSAGFTTAIAQQLGDYYTFSAQSGTFTPLSGATTVIFSSTGGGVGAYNEAATAGPYNIGFNFIFNGITYTQFTLNARGFLVLGTTLSSDANNVLERPSIAEPLIAAHWDQQHMYDGSATCAPPVDVHVSYMMTGVAPNRVLHVEWGTQLVSSATYYYGGNCLPMLHYQARLYECSNRIEFQYGNFRISTNTLVHGTASIGLASGSNNFISVTPGTIHSASSAGANNLVDNNNVLSTTLIPAGTIYSFTHVMPELVGRTGAGNGGTVKMTNGDTLFQGAAYSSPIGTPAIYRPFNLTVPAGGCAGRPYSLKITGAAAGDYYLNNTPGTQFAAGVVNSGATITPTITFSPTATGVREATLTYIDSSNGIARTYLLAATGTSRMVFTGNVPQGGTPQVKSGDTLLMGKYVVRFTSQSFTPLTVTNGGTNPALPPAAVTYTITDSTGQYSVSPANASLANGASSTPSITFNATGMGPQSAKLTVNADGEVRTYVLYAIAAVPSAIFRIAGEKIDSSTTLFQKEVTCVGEDVYTYEVEVENIGGVPFVIDGLELYQTDTLYKQGVPRYPLTRDQLGQLIPSSEYFISLTPPTAPVTEEQKVSYPIVLPITPANTKLYLSFVGTRPGKRFVRMFLRTNGQNFATTDTNGMVTTGLLRLDLFGRTNGSQLSDNANGGLPQTIKFTAAHIGDSVDVNAVLFNPGLCTLRISLNSMEILAGDVDEFMIVKKPSSLVDPATGDLLLPPGASDVIALRFKPLQVGSRRAGLRLMTNDSTIQIPGITERGVFYIDLFGNGRADVYADDLEFGTALIGGGFPDHLHGFVRLKNTLNGPIVITKIFFDGVDVSEFTRDGNTSWPQIPVVLTGGQEINLGVEFAPIGGGQPGSRKATVKFITSNGDTIVSNVTGTAGTRTIDVTPTTVNFGTVTAGKLLRRTITINNTGTMPLTLQTPVLSAGSDFSFGTMPRMVLAPGQTEYLELTYAPQSSGASNATLTVGSNASNGAIQVTLNGVATKTKLVIDDPSVTAVKGGDNGTLAPVEHLSLSGVNGEDLATGLQLLQSVPNPARDQVEIRYMLASGGDIRLELYDGSGRLVRVLDAGHRQAGETRVMVDVRELASGTYHYRLSAGSSTVSRTMTIAR